MANYTKEQVTGILAELEEELKKGEAEVVAKLVKADGDAPPEDDKSPTDSESASPAPDASAGPAEAPPAPDASASAGGPPPGPDASAGGAAPSGDPAQDAQLTPEALQAEYSQLPPEELDMHIQAALAAKEALSAAAGPAAGGMPPPAAGGMPPPGPDASAGGMPPPMGKEEMNINKEATGGKITKSEDLVATIVAKVTAAFDAKFAALQKNTSEDVENLAKAVTTIISTPVRKAITSLNEVPGALNKSEVKPMTRKEVDAFISAHAHKMSKSERDLWMDFVDNKVPASKLVPMLDRLTSLKQ
jgi:hypothetical protein